MYNVNAEGYLVDRDDWDENFMIEAIKADGYTEVDRISAYCIAARDMYEETGTVPPIRVFAKHFGMDRKAKEMYELFETAPMKRICRYAGLPQPTGCV